MNIIRRLKKKARNSDLLWKYGFNFGPTLAYALSQSKLQGEAERVAGVLASQGVCITSVEDLFGSTSVLTELCTALAARERSLEKEIETARLDAAEGKRQVHKNFAYRYFGKNAALDKTSPFWRFALQSPLPALVNSHYRTCMELRTYDVWRTFVSSGEASFSQLWHRDNEDRFVLKVFLYLTDVDAGTGPFIYAKGTHLRSGLRSEPEYVVDPTGQKRCTDEQMRKVLPEDQWLKCTGRAGTLILADTHGFHKGGWCEDQERLMYIAMFNSVAA